MFVEFRQVLPGADEDLGGLGDMDDLAGSFMASWIHVPRWQLWQLSLWWKMVALPYLSPKVPLFVCIGIRASKMWITCAPKSCNLQANGLDFELAEKPTSAENVDIGYSRNSKFVDSCPIFGLMFMVFEISWIPVKAPKSREPKAVESCWEPETCLDGENMRKHHCPLVVSASLLGRSSAKLVMLSWFYPIVIIMLALC